MLMSAVILLSGSLLDPNPGLIFWTAITFVLVLLILKKIAWGPILGALEEREKVSSHPLTVPTGQRMRLRRFFVKIKKLLQRPRPNPTGLSVRAGSLQIKFVQKSLKRLIPSLRK